MVDSITKKVIHIDFPPRHTKPSSSSSMYSPTGLDLDLSSSKTTPPTLSEDAFSASNRERIPPPLENGDFLPDLMKENAEKTGKPFKLRDDIKPLHIVQPEGVSFKMNGHELEWQKWKMHICTYKTEMLPHGTYLENQLSTTERA